MIDKNQTSKIISVSQSGRVGGPGEPLDIIEMDKKVVGKLKVIGKW